jgi:hypothetical protein
VTTTKKARRGTPTASNHRIILAAIYIGFMSEVDAAIELNEYDASEA